MNAGPDEIPDGDPPGGISRRSARRGWGVALLLFQLIWLLAACATSWTVQQQVKNLQDGDPDARIAAAERLGALGPDAKTAVSDLTLALGGSMQMRRAAFKALRSILEFPDKIVPVLVDAAGDEDPKVREGAVWSIGEMGPQAREAVPVLVRALEDEQADVRLAALHAVTLVSPQSEETVHFLIPALQDTNLQIRRGAVMHLKELGPHAREAVPARVSVLGDEDPTVRATAAETLRTIGAAMKEAIPGLLHALADVNPGVRRMAAEKLGELGPEAREAVPALVRILGDDVEEVRTAASQALENIGTAMQNAVPALIEALEDADPNVRRTAAEKLRGIGPQARDAIPYLVRALGGGDASSQRAAAMALWEAGPAEKAALPALIEALGDPNVEVRKGAVEALEDMGTQAGGSVPHLVNMLGDSDGLVRALTAVALGRVAGTPREAALALVRGLGSPETAVRIGAIRTLGEMGLQAGSAVSALVQALAGDRDDQVREWAAWALMQIRPPAGEAIPAITNALADPDPNVRRMATWALNAMDPDGPGVTPLVVRSLTTQDPKSCVLSALSLSRITRVPEEATAAVVKALADPERDVRARAARVLGEIGPAAASAVPALLLALEDRDPGVRENAAQALAGIPLYSDQRDKVQETLTKLAETDPDGDVRGAAAEAARRVKLCAPAPESVPGMEGHSPGTVLAALPNRHDQGACGQRFAVVVGIAKYKYAGRHDLQALSYADDDAQDFAGTLENMGWRPGFVKTLINEEATRRNLLIALESWLTKAGPDDQVVLFWAGHGFPDPENPEKVYFACYDTDLSIPATGFRMDQVRSALEECRARNVIVLADTCHAGKLITRGERGISILPSIQRMQREQDVPKGWIFMVGAEADRLAIEDSSWTNGAFTHCLLKGLAGAADGYMSAGARDRIVTMGELRSYMSSAMPEETYKVLGVAKRPVITTNTGDPDIWNLTLCSAPLGPPPTDSPHGQQQKN